MRTDEVLEVLEVRPLVVAEAPAPADVDAGSSPSRVVAEPAPSPVTA